MIEPRWYQTAAVDAVYSYFERYSGSPVIVLPTGSGKSVVIATFIQRALCDWPDTRVLCISHVREILTQDVNAMLAVWPEAPVGVYSAGLKSRDIDAQILFASIQSIYRRAHDLRRVDLVIIDEAHLLSTKSESMYRRLLRELGKTNPWLKCIGATATPFRLDQGYLHEGTNALFDALAYEAPIRRLIDEGYLCHLISKRTETQLDVTGVGTRGGEYIPGQLAAAVDKAAVTAAAVREIVARGADRRTWLVFCSGVDHAHHVRDEIRKHGVSCETVTGETPADERNAHIEGFRSRQIRCLTNANVLTTGVDVPGIDLIAFLRPTKSAGLYQQMAGRGLRNAPEKANCLILDHARVIETHGPIDDVRPPRPGNGNGNGVAPTKFCPECKTIVAAASLECPDCGYVFPPREIKINGTASNLEILSSDRPEWVDVTRVNYRKHEKPGKPPSLRVDYFCGLVRHSEWVTLEHPGYPRQKAIAWWGDRTGRSGLHAQIAVFTPRTVVEALQRTNELRPPKAIHVKPDGKFTKIIGARFA